MLERESNVVGEREKKKGSCGKKKGCHKRVWGLVTVRTTTTTIIFPSLSLHCGRVLSTFSCLLFFPNLPSLQRSCISILPQKTMLSMLYCIYYFTHTIFFLNTCAFLFYLIINYSTFLSFEVRGMFFIHVLKINTRLE